MANPGNVLSRRFRNHSPCNSPQPHIINGWFSDMDQAEIQNQVKHASWFIAELWDRPSFGGVNGELYLIYSPSSADGQTAITSLTNSKAKVVAAPNPPFNQGEEAAIIEFILTELESLKKFSISKNG